MTTPIAVTVHLSPALADQLITTSTWAFALEQLDRFEVLSEDANIIGQQWAGGTQLWCATAADTLLRIAYEQACGYAAVLLWDLAAAEQGTPAYVLVTTRPWEH